jgi:hypothetical protein
VNEELLAASVKVVPYWSLIMVSSTFLQLSNVKPTKVCSAPAGRQVISTILAPPFKGIMTSILPLKMPTDY